MTLTLVGCTRYREETTTVTVREPVAPAPAPVARGPITVDELILAVQQAGDPRSEADALNQLHNWMSNHLMTYDVRVTDLRTGAVVRGPSAVTERVQTTVTIMDRTKPYRDFVFIPRDNRNLEILGVQ